MATEALSISPLKRGVSERIGCISRGRKPRTNRWRGRRRKAKVTVTRVALECDAAGRWLFHAVRETNSDVHLKACCSQLIFKMSESRTELIAWVNELLQLNYTKVEQCGTGGAYCQIIDSIYGKLEISVEVGCLQRILTSRLSGDLPMTRVKMNAKHEYEFIANFKVLQNSFKAHKVEKVPGHFVVVQEIVLNILEAHSCRQTREMQDAVRSYLNRS